MYLSWFQLVPFSFGQIKDVWRTEIMRIFAADMKKDKPEYDDIRRMVEDMTGRKMQTPKDFDFLARMIFERTSVLLSVSTLKRFWGYVAKDDETRGEMRRDSLNTLAVYVGYADWDTF